MQDAARYTIVAGLDFSGPSVHALREVIEEAARHPEADLHFITVVDEGTGIGLPAASRDSHVAESALRVRERLVDSVRASIEERFAGKGAPPFRTTVHVRVGRPADEILKLASDVEADLVAVATQGRRGMERFLLGSVAERVLRAASCTVLVVRPKGTVHEAEAAPEPPCPDCVAQRRSTAGKEWWCATHAAPRLMPHALTTPQTFHYSSPLWFGADA